MIDTSKDIFEIENSTKLSIYSSLFATDIVILHREENGKLIFMDKHKKLIAYTLIGRTKGGIIFFMYLDSNEKQLTFSSYAPDGTIDSINLLGEIIYLDSFHSYKLRVAMKNKNFSCMDLANATSISSRTLERYISGNRDFSGMNVENAIKIANALEVNVSELY